MSLVCKHGDSCWCVLQYAAAGLVLSLDVYFLCQIVGLVALIKTMPHRHGVIWMLNERCLEKKMFDCFSFRSGGGGCSAEVDIKGFKGIHFLPRKTKETRMYCSIVWMYCSIVWMYCSNVWVNCMNVYHPSDFIINMYKGFRRGDPS